MHRARKNDFTIQPKNTENLSLPHVKPHKIHIQNIKTENQNSSDQISWEKTPKKLSRISSNNKNPYENKFSYMQ